MFRGTSGCFPFIIGFVVITATIIAGILTIVDHTQSSIEGIAFQQSHPIVQATVLNTFTHTYTEDDPQNHTTTERTEICAGTVKFLANGQEIKVNVASQMECGVQVGDQRKIAYDPQHPSHVEFVPAGGPLWGNILGLITAVAFGGFALSVGIGLLSGFLADFVFINSRIDLFMLCHRAGTIFWIIGAAGIVLSIILHAFS